MVALVLTSMMSALEVTLPVLMTFFTALFSLFPIFFSLFSLLSDYFCQSNDVNDSDKQPDTITPTQPIQLPQITSDIKTHPCRTSANAHRSGYNSKRRDKQALCNDLSASSTAHNQAYGVSHADHRPASRRHKVKSSPATKEDTKLVPKTSFKYQDNPFDLPPSGAAAGRIKIMTEVYDKHSILRLPFRRRMDPETADEESRAFFQKYRERSSRSSPVPNVQVCEGHSAQPIDEASVESLETVQTAIITPSMEPNCLSTGTQSEEAAADCESVLDSATNLENLGMNMTHCVMPLSHRVPPPVKVATLGPREKYTNTSKRAALARTIHAPTRITPGMKNLFLDDMDSLDHKFGKLWKELNHNSLGLSKVYVDSRAQDEDRTVLDMDVDIDPGTMEVDDLEVIAGVAHSTYNTRTETLLPRSDTADMEDVQSSPQAGVRPGLHVDDNAAVGFAIPDPPMKLTPPTLVLALAKTLLQCPPVRNQKYRPLVKPLVHLLPPPSPTPYPLFFHKAVGLESPTSSPTSIPWDFINKPPIPHFSNATGSKSRTPSPRARFNTGTLCAHGHRRQTNRTR